MPAWLRSILAVVGGLAAAVVVVIVFDLINSLLFPLPSGIDPSDPAAMRALAESMPAGAFAVLIVGWLAASFIGS